MLLTNSRGPARRLEVRHRRHGEVENRIRNAKHCGLKRMPFGSFDGNAAWMEMVLAAADLLVRSQQLLLDGGLAVADRAPCGTGSCASPAASSTAPDRCGLRLPDHCPWTGDLLDAYRRLAAIT